MIAPSAPSADPAAAVPTRQAQVANYLTANSGGLRVVVQALADEHLRRGGQRLLVTPGAADLDLTSGPDRRVTISSPPLPGSGSYYHVLLARASVIRALNSFGPDLLQIHDQTTLAWLGGWARRAGIPTVLFAHEQLSLVANEIGVPRRFSHSLGRRWGERLANQVDAVVCASDFAARPFDAAGGHNVHRIPFGVDLATFVPRPRVEVAPPWRPGCLRLIHVARLHPAKGSDVALETLSVLSAAGVDAELVMIGAGPLEAAMRQRIARERLPVHMLGYICDRARIAALTAAADVALATGARETFGFSVLEAMAAGTPVVVSDRGGSRELLAPGAGAIAADAGEAAAATLRLAADPTSGRRARQRAEQFSWATTFAAIDALQGSLVRPRASVG